SVEGDDFAVVRRPRRFVLGADVGLVVGRAFERELRRRRLIGKMHHHAAGRPKRNHVRLLALLRRGRLDARAVLVLVIGGKAPSPDDVLRREGGRQRRHRRRGSRRLRHRRTGGAGTQPQSKGGEQQSNRQATVGRTAHRGSPAARKATLRGQRVERKRGFVISGFARQAASAAAGPASGLALDTPPARPYLPPRSHWHSQSSSAKGLRNRRFLYHPVEEAMAKTKFRPLHDRVVVRRIEADNKTKGGIIIPDTAQEKPSQGEVVSVGPGGRDEAGKLIPIDVKAGDKVLFGKWSGTEVKLDGEDFLIMKESDIMGVIA